MDAMTRALANAGLIYDPNSRSIVTLSELSVGKIDMLRSSSIGGKSPRILSPTNNGFLSPVLENFKSFEPKLISTSAVPGKFNSPLQLNVINATNVEINKNHNVPMTPFTPPPFLHQLTTKTAKSFLKPLPLTPFTPLTPNSSINNSSSSPKLNPRSLSLMRPTIPPPVCSFLYFHSIFNYSRHLLLVILF